MNTHICDYVCICICVCVSVCMCLYECIVCVSHTLHCIYAIMLISFDSVKCNKCTLMEYVA